ncbi:MAG: hypothetical protein ACP5NO_08210 [Thermoplasmata archaeon]
MKGKPYPELPVLERGSRILRIDMISMISRDEQKPLSISIRVKGSYDGMDLRSLFNWYEGAVH